MENTLTTYAINGFGRIGKLVTRILINKNANISFINDPEGDLDSIAYQLKFDSVHGKFSNEVKKGSKAILVNDKKIQIENMTNIDTLPKDSADVVIDCTGKFKSPIQKQAYISLGFSKIIVSAAIPDELGVNIVYGVNESIYSPELHTVLSASSCTTNCLAPVVMALHESLGIKHGSYTTIHDVTNTQTIVDRPSRDLRRSRSALINLIPSTTNSARAITQIYPELKGKLTGHAVRVPILNASLTDCSFEMLTPTSREEVNNIFKKYASKRLSGILGYEENPLVSSDYVGDSRSSIIDAMSTLVINETQVKLYAWYDNEFGYANRLADVAQLAGTSL